VTRRDFITLLGGAAAAWPLTASAQQPDRMRRIGVLLQVAEGDPQARIEVAAFLRELQELGWSESRNVRIDTRWGGGNADRIRKYAAELVALAPEAVLAPVPRGRSPASVCFVHSWGHLRKTQLLTQRVTGLWRVIETTHPSASRSRCR
jgi:hypothetical protein